MVPLWTVSARSSVYEKIILIKPFQASQSWHQLSVYESKILVQNCWHNDCCFFAIYAILLLKEVKFFFLSFFNKGRSDKILSGKMGTNVTKIVYIFDTRTQIGDEEPYYNTKISIFSFIWAGLSDFAMATWERISHKHKCIQFIARVWWDLPYLVSVTLASDINTAVFWHCYSVIYYPSW